LQDQLPDQEKVQFAMAVGPEEAIVVGFKWTDSYEKAASIASMYRDKIKAKRAEWIKNGYNLSSNNENTQEAIDRPMVVVREGVNDWIKSLQDVEMACGVTSYLNEDQVDILLRYAGLSSLLPREKRVSLSNGYDRDSQQMLGAALRIERRPDHCVVFDSSPGACGAAREVEMRSVAMVGPYPRYELLSADTSAFSFSELTAMNIRRLFGERVYDQPMLDSLQNQPEIRRKTKTAFWDPDE
jgi:beta-phosphoglucomutase-like phosphatase (HAD superfamily)